MGNTQEQNEPADKAQCPEQSTVSKNSGQIYTCTDCGLTGCRKEDGNYPPFCLTMQTESGELDEIAALYASDSIDGTIAKASAKFEGNYYCRKTRVEETVLFIKAIGAKRVGIATCAGLINEAKTFSKILKKSGIDHVSIPRTEMVYRKQPVNDFSFAHHGNFMILAERAGKIISIAPNR